jgi:3-oxoacyl-[acyl-carrier protein] reductase
MDVKDKRVIVTGGVRGLGRCLVEKLVVKGARVTVFDIDTHGLAELARQHESITCVTCDVSDAEQVASVLNVYHDKYGAVHVLVNNAGILYSEPLVRIGSGGLVRHGVEAWNRVLSANLSSVFFMTSHVVEKMVTTRTKGVIVNISSVAAAGNAGQSIYSAAKAGVNALTATWAKELGSMGIRVVAVAPGFTQTESTKEALSEAMLQETIKRVPLHRLGKPEEIADGVIAVIENDFFNGKVFELDGGLII